MFKLVISICVLIRYGSCLQCLSCDDYKKCEEPFSIVCPDSDVCYKLSENGKVITMGCSLSCTYLSYSVNIVCQQCKHRDFCNGPEQGHGHGVIREHHHKLSNGTIVITNGTNPEDDFVFTKGIPVEQASSYSFWSWLWPFGSSSKASFGVNIFAFPIIAYLIH